MKRMKMSTLNHLWKAGRILIIISTPHDAEIRWTKTNRKQNVEIIK